MWTCISNGTTCKAFQTPLDISRCWCLSRLGILKITTYSMCWCPTAGHIICYYHHITEILLHSTVILRWNEPTNRCFGKVYKRKNLNLLKTKMSVFFLLPSKCIFTLLYNYWLVMRAIYDMLDLKTKYCPRPKAEGNILSEGPTYHMLPESPVNNCFVIPSLV